MQCLCTYAEDVRKGSLGQCLSLNSSVVMWELLPKMTGSQVLLVILSQRDKGKNLPCRGLFDSPPGS